MNSYNSSEVMSLWSRIEDRFNFGDHDRRASERVVERLVARIVKNVAVTKYAIEDYLSETGGDYMLADRIEPLARLWNIPLSNVHHRPRAGKSESLGFVGLRAADFAAYLICARGNGLAVDPDPLVRALRPTIIKQPFVTGSELKIIWWNNGTHWTEPSNYVTDLPNMSAHVLLPNGYRAAIGPLGLSVASPRVSKAKWRSVVLCAGAPIEMQERA